MRCFIIVTKTIINLIKETMYRAKFFQILAATAIVSFMFSACDNDDPGIVDTEAPTIEISDPANGAFMAAGEYAHLEAVFTDNVELGSYDIDVHNTFDGHTHGRVAQRNEDPSLLKWSYKQSFSIPAGRKNYDAHLHDEIMIIGNAMAGPYHFIVQAVDASGNATSYADGSTVELEVYITNDSQPVVNITNLENGELEIETGVLFTVEGDITDPTTGQYAGIHAVEAMLGEEHQHEHDNHTDGRIAEEDQSNLFEVVYEGSALDPFINGGAIMLNALFEDIGFVLSANQLNKLISENIDHLILTIKAFDEQGNIAFHFTSVHVHVN